jgi:hypothetical protein
VFTPEHPKGRPEITTSNRVRIIAGGKKCLLIFNAVTPYKSKENITHNCFFENDYLPLIRSNPKWELLLFAEDKFGVSVTCCRNR